MSDSELKWSPSCRTTDNVNYDITCREGHITIVNLLFGVNHDEDCPPEECCSLETTCEAPAKYVDSDFLERVKRDCDQKSSCTIELKSRASHIICDNHNSTWANYVRTIFACSKGNYFQVRAMTTRSVYY